VPARRTDVPVAPDSASACYVIKHWRCEGPLLRSVGTAFVLTMDGSARFDGANSPLLRVA